MKFPKLMFVRFEEERNGLGCFITDEQVKGKHGDKVAIYKLHEVKTLVIKEELV